MAIVFWLSCTARHLASVRHKEVAQILLRIDIVHNLPEAHRIRSAGVPVLERAYAKAVAQEKLFVEGR